MAVVLSNDEGSSSKPAKLYLTITLSADTCSSAVTPDDASIPITTEVGDQPAERAIVSFVAQHAVEFLPAIAPSEPLSPSTDYPPNESRAPAIPAVDYQPEGALRDADNAVEMMNLHETWENALGRIKWVMDTVTPIAGVRTLSGFAFL